MLEFLLIYLAIGLVFSSILYWVALAAHRRYELPVTKTRAQIVNMFFRRVIAWPFFFVMLITVWVFMLVRR